MTATTHNHAIEVDARWENLPTLTDFTAEIEQSYDLTAEQAFVLGLVVEEIVTNIIKYSYKDEGGPLQILCAVSDTMLTLKIRDRGEPFSPEEAAAPDLGDSVADRTVGGLGVFLVREMADSLEYRHDPESGWNELVVTKGKALHANSPLVDFLGRLPLFDGVQVEILSRLVETAHHQRLAPGAFLMKEGEVGAECFIVVAGEIEVVKQIGDETMLLERCMPGRIIGEMALIDNSPRAASVVARTEATLLRITEAEFMTLMHANPKTAMALLRGGTARLRSSTAQMIHGLELKNVELARAYNDLKAAQGELLRLERIERELAIARQIHRFFLPPSIQQPSGWQLAAFNQGALEVGGDFYDVIELADGLVGLVVADACGKGVPAALFVALTRSLLRSTSQTLASRSAEALDPSELISSVMKIVNDYISIEHGASNMFTTLFYAIFDPKSAALTYVNAGHNPPLIIDTGTGEIRDLPASNLPIGIMGGLEFPPVTTKLGASEILLGFTDGATEAFNIHGDVFDDAHLEFVLRQGGYNDAASLLEEVRAAIMAFVGEAPQADDITLLTLSHVL